LILFFFSSRRRHTSSKRDWSSDVCSSDLQEVLKYKQPVESFPLFWLKNLLVALVVLAFAWQLANSRGLPVVLILLAALILIYGRSEERRVGKEWQAGGSAARGGKSAVWHA